MARLYTNIKILTFLNFIPLAAISPFVLMQCTALPQRSSPDVKFIIIGNTSPTSPFAGNAERLPDVLRSINHEDPVLVIHTGNIVQGGYEWMGITKKDVIRQYRNAIEQTKILTSVIHILAGEKDQLNGSLDLFKYYIGKRLYSSFNYGDSHFILLHIIDRDQRMSPDQMRWLREDLEHNKNSSAIFIFSHYPVLSFSQNMAQFDEGSKLHELFTRYPVKAVISGASKNFYEHERDNVRYIEAGCYGFNNNDRYWYYYQYYIGHYYGNGFSIHGVRVNFSARPRTKIPAEERLNK
jgi:3',5'-cyclic AMP phosphodiesterase CpdA